VENSAFATGQDANGNDVLDISDAGDETIETPDGLGNTNGDPTDDPTVSDLTSFPQLTFTKTASVGGSGGALGDVITYTFTVTNTGAQTVSNISIDDALTGSVEIVLNPSTLAPGETGIATAAYTIAQADVDAGYVQNSATVTGQDPMGNNVIDVSDAGNETIESPDGSGNVDGDPTNDPTVVLVDVEFEIFDAITPDDGDGQNDVFTIAGLQNFPDNNVKIYNRWGVLVYEKSQYHIGDGFRGISDGRVTIQQEKKLPAGVYYYVLTYVDGGVGKSIAGPLYIKR
ncbi:MAG: gliding motility-associated C-terminal domain-containing protein, partial [Flavobacteriaceae bacterium]|nr:gliding motility-associated C-terminal domain-containing protein [Bacteroidia bacterium]NNL62028.1 gliding motility-associated C-terminal domain-containing protein [Flavobacteriaceae bacterium]